MASAIIKGVISSKFAQKENIIGSEINSSIAKLAQEKLDIQVITNNKELVKNSDIIFIAT